MKLKASMSRRNS